MMPLWQHTRYKQGSCTKCSSDTTAKHHQTTKAKPLSMLWFLSIPEMQVLSTIIISSLLPVPYVDSQQEPKQAEASSDGNKLNCVSVYNSSMTAIRLSGKGKTDWRNHKCGCLVTKHTFPLPVSSRNNILQVFLYYSINFPGQFTKRRKELNCKQQMVKAVLKTVGLILSYKHGR